MKVSFAQLSTLNGDAVKRVTQASCSSQRGTSSFSESLYIFHEKADN